MLTEEQVELILAIKRELEHSDIVWPKYGSESTFTLAAKIAEVVKNMKEVH